MNRAFGFLSPIEEQLEIEINFVSQITGDVHGEFFAESAELLSRWTGLVPRTEHAWWRLQGRRQWRTGHKRLKPDNCACVNVHPFRVSAGQTDDAFKNEASLIKIRRSAFPPGALRPDTVSLGTRQPVLLRATEDHRLGADDLAACKLGTGYLLIGNFNPLPGTYHSAGDHQGRSILR